MDTIAILKMFGQILWPFLLILILIAIFTFAKEYLESPLNRYIRGRNFDSASKWRSDENLRKWLSQLSHKEFEEQTAEMFTRRGYSAKVTGASHDMGVDVEIYKDNIKSIVQCKHYKGKVGRPEIAKFYGDLAHHQVDKGYFVTTGMFTLEAERYAEDKPIELIDGRTLVRYMKETKIGLEDNLVTETPCPKCDSALVIRNGKHGKFLGCSKFPNCDFTKSI